MKRHWAFQSHVLDLGIFTQLAFTGAHGKFFDFTIKPEYSNFLGYHFSPMLIILSLAYLVVPRIETTLAVQALLLASAVIPLYLLAYRVLRNKFLALAIGLAYLAHPFISQTVMFDFHEVSIEPVIIFTMFYFLSKNTRFWYWLFFALALFCKEDVALFMIPVGLFLMFNEKEYKIGLSTSLVSLLYAILAFKLLMPAFSDISGYSFNWVFAYLGNSPIEILKTVSLNPLFILKKCSNWLNLRTIFFLLAPLMFAPLWSRWGLLLIITPLFEVWLHESPVASQGSYHHILVAVPFTFIAGIIGLKNLTSKYVNKMVEGRGKSRSIMNFFKE